MVFVKRLPMAEPPIVRANLDIILRIINYLDVTGFFAFTSCNKLFHGFSKDLSSLRLVARNLVRLGVPLIIEGNKRDVDLSAEEVRAAILLSDKCQRIWRSEITTPDSIRKFDPLPGDVVSCQALTSDLAIVHINVAGTDSLQLGVFRFADCRYFPVPVLELPYYRDHRQHASGGYFSREEMTYYLSYTADELDKESIMVAKIHLDTLIRGTGSEVDVPSSGGPGGIVEVVSSYEMGVSRQKFCHESVYILDEGQKMICVIRRAKSRCLQLFFVPNWTDQALIAVDTQLEYSLNYHNVCCFWDAQKQSVVLQRFDRRKIGEVAHFVFPKSHLLNIAPMTQSSSLPTLPPSHSYVKTSCVASLSGPMPPSTRYSESMTPRHFHKFMGTEAPRFAIRVLNLALTDDTGNYTRYSGIETFASDTEGPSILQLAHGIYSSMPLPRLIEYAYDDSDYNALAWVRQELPGNWIKVVRHMPPVFPDDTISKVPVCTVDVRQEEVNLKDVQFLAVDSTHGRIFVGTGTYRSGEQKFFVLSFV